MEDQPNVVLVLTTVKTEEQANALAQQLLDEHLIACSTIVPTVRSRYRWGGELVTESESLIMLKTSAELVEQLKERLQQLHPYEVPEIIVLSPSDVARAYAAWVEASTTPQNN